MLAIGRRVSWGLADQVLSSATNFALTVFVAHSASGPEFGAFAITMATYLLVVGLEQGLVSQPFAVRYSTSEMKAARRAMSHATGTALGLGILAGAVCALAGAALGGPLRLPLLALGLSLPGLLLQDAWRFLFVALARPAQAAANDAIWALIQGLGFAAVLLGGSSSPALLLGVWGAAAGGAAVVGCWQARCLPTPIAALSWLRAERELAFRFAAQALVIRGAAQLTYTTMALIAGLGAAGTVRAAQVVFSPLTLLYQGLLFAAVPEAVRSLRAPAHTFSRFTSVVSVGATATAAVWILIVLVLPRAPGELLLGAMWAPAHPLLPLLAVQTVAVALSIGPQVGIRALGAAGRGLRTDALQASLLLIAGSVGARWAGSVGAAIGLASATSIGAIVWWLALKSASRVPSARSELPVARRPI